MRRGFTLIELLVVIAIIAILAAILFPVFARARDSAKKAQCLSNFKQGALSILLYKDDNGDRSVPTTERGFGMNGYAEWEGPGSHDRAWPELCQQYMKSWNVIRCPADKYANDNDLSRDFNNNDAYIPPTETELRHFSWGFRAYLGLNHNWFSYNPTPCNNLPNGMKNVRFGSIGATAKTIMLTDSIWERDDNGIPYGGGNWAVDSPCWPSDMGCYLGGWVCWTSLKNGDPNSPECISIWNAWGGSYPWHGGKTIFNTAYADGHVRSNRLGDLLKGVNAFVPQILDLQEYQWDTIE
jgi:prepilin-type N-terminal cleavage/methylation domain-containing protein/prepilin-type processing-associated H-X9-DG protein